MILYRPTHNGVTFSVSRYSTADIDENAEVHSRYNFKPSLATFDEWLVISSTESLARDLIDALKAETAKQPKALAGVHSLVEVNGRQLVSILKANRANLVRQNMIDDGLLDYASMLDGDVEIGISFADDGDVTMTVTQRP